MKGKDKLDNDVKKLKEMGVVYLSCATFPNREREAIDVTYQLLVDVGTDNYRCFKMKIFDGVVDSIIKNEREQNERG